jgi:hypothetical protein
MEKHWLVHMLEEARVNKHFCITGRKPLIAIKEAKEK